MVTSAMPQTPARRVELILLVALITGVAIAAAGAVWLLASVLAGGGNSNEGPSAAGRVAFEEATGVRVVRVAVTGGGGLVDLRYQVLDPEKALVVHERPPALVAESTGEVVDTLFMGHRHSGRPKLGLTYPLLFVNRSSLIRGGDEVSVVLGGTSLQHVVVE